MRKILPIILVSVFGACSADFEPNLSGATANIDFHTKNLLISINGRQKEFKLTTVDSINYYNPQWTNRQDFILAERHVDRDNCFDYQIVKFDTTGTITDTVYTPKKCTIVDYMLSPNDSLLLIRSYSYKDWRDKQFGNVKYEIYDLQSKVVTDSIIINNTKLNLDSFIETIWSPDSRKVLVFEKMDMKEKAFIYDLNRNDTTFIGVGVNFTWSPSDNNLVAYIQDLSLYTLDLKTDGREEIYHGRRKKKVTDFRWGPKGDFLMVNVSGYMLNIESKMTWDPLCVYISIPDKRKSKEFWYNQRIETWK